MNRSWVPLLLLACGGGAGERAPVALQVVDGNPGHAALGAVAGLAEADGALVVFGGRGATVLRGGAVAASDPSVQRWKPGSAALVPAADGAGRWVVAVAADGRALRLAAPAALEEIGPRYGVGKAVGMTGVDRRGVALALADGVAVADGAHVTRYPGRFTAVAGGSGKLVGTGGDRVEIWDLVHGKARAFALPGAAWVGVTSRGWAVVASPTSVWVERADGSLDRRFAASGIRGLAVSGDRVWIAAGDELVLLADGAVSRTRGASLGADVLLAAASGGGVWAATGGRVMRYTVAAPDEWSATVGPLFSRVCSRCHLPGGTADLDLSTAAAWNQHKGEIRARVLEKRTMPPAGTPFADADRQVIARWLAGGS